MLHRDTHLAQKTDTVSERSKEDRLDLKTIFKQPIFGEHSWLTGKMQHMYIAMKFTTVADPGDYLKDKKKSDSH